MRFSLASPMSTGLSLMMTVATRWPLYLAKVLLPLGLGGRSKLLSGHLLYGAITHQNCSALAGRILFVAQDGVGGAGAHAFYIGTVNKDQFATVQLFSRFRGVGEILLEIIGLARRF